MTGLVWRAWRRATATIAHWLLERIAPTDAHAWAEALAEAEAAQDVWEPRK